MKNKFLDWLPHPFFLVGTTTGAILLLSRWITGNPLISSEHSLVTYGLWFGLIVAITQGLSLLVLGFSMKKLTIPENSVYLYDQIEKRLDSGNRFFFKMLLFIVQIELWFTQIIVIHTFGKIVFPSYEVEFTILSVFAIIFSHFFIYIRGYYVLNYMFIVIFFATITCIPIYYFVLNGAAKIYEGIRLFHPYILFFKQSHILMLGFAYLLVSLGHVLLDSATWYNLSLIHKQKRSKSLYTAGSIKVFVSFTFTAILMLAIFRGPFEDFENLLLTFFYRDDWLLLNYLFGTFILFAVFIALMNSLKSLQHTINFKKSPWVYVALIVPLLFVCLFANHLDLVSIILAFAVLFGTVLPLTFTLLFTHLSIPKYSYIASTLLIIYGEILLIHEMNLLLILLQTVSLNTLFIILFKYRSIR